MGKARLDKSWFIIGLLLIAAAIGLMVFMKGDSHTAAAIGLSVLGIVTIAVSRMSLRS